MIDDVNFTCLIHTGNNDDPYIQAKEAQMVYYVVDQLAKDWSIIKAIRLI